MTSTTSTTSVTSGILRPAVQISNKAKHKVLQGHPWIFRGEVFAEAAIPAGEIVRIVDKKDGLIGQGFFNGKSLISIRLIAFGDGEIDTAFWRKRIFQALSLRRQITSPESNACRLIYAESDGIPGLIVDDYNGHLVVSSLCAGTERLLAPFSEILIQDAGAISILARNDQQTRLLEGMTEEKRALFGHPPEWVDIRENGLSMRVDIWNGHKTGTYLDQRLNHLAASKYAKDRKTLDVFCYQGGFALPCARTGGEVTAVDISAPALEALEENARRNHLSGIRTIHANGFDFLYDAAKKGTSYDMVILDPPAFAKKRESAESASRGYKELNLRAMKLLSPGGILVTCSCSFHMSEDRFVDVLKSAALSSHRNIQILERLGQPPDHPVRLGHPESNYLKCFILRAL